MEEGVDVLDHILALSQGALTTSLIVLGPILLATMVVGLLVGIFQATTQIQELTLSFLPKLVVLGVMIYLAGPWFLRILVAFAHQDFSQFWHVSFLP